MLLNSLFKDNSINTTGCWIIYLIENGLKCEHISSLHEEYFESDELMGTGSFAEKERGMTPLDVFQRMLEITPNSKGFVYKTWDLINHKQQGFIIRPRVTCSNGRNDIEIYKRNLKYERYRTNQSLRDIEIVNFLEYLEEGSHDKNEF